MEVFGLYVHCTVYLVVHSKELICFDTNSAKETQSKSALCVRKLRVSQLVPERPKSMFEHPIITKDRQRTSSSDTLVLQQTDSGHTAIGYSFTHSHPCHRHGVY